MTTDRSRTMTTLRRATATATMAVLRLAPRVAPRRTSARSRAAAPHRRSRSSRDVPFSNRPSPLRRCAATSR
eukprot:6850733-Prymnesium_polylepis.1